MVTKIYAEGGGSKALNRECRRGFRAFLSKAGVAPGTVEVEACGPRGNAYETFSADAGRGSAGILLVDAEGPVTAQSPWEHLQASDGWSRPSGVADDQCHLMAQVMESWFLADTDTLESFYERGFQKQALPRNPNVEDVPKQDVLDGLGRATQGAGKGGYKKGADSFEILARLDPAKVRAAAPHAERFIQALSS